jgi:hypothetical protein
MSRRIALVTTTINVPRVLEHHVELARASEDAVSIIVAGDRKTPAEAADFCRHLGIEYLGVDEQERFLVDFPALARALPWNSVQRRDVALLKAYADGADVIVTIDDDNYPLADDFFSAHRIVGEWHRLPTLVSDSVWLNVCDLLDDADGQRFFHRGFPLDRRWDSAPARVEGTRDAVLAVNAGLWLGDPDVDALTRVYRMVEATRVAPQLETSVVLGEGHWSPFDSQNTALSRAALRGYFLSPDVGRMDDIWASYLTLRSAQHLGECVAFGAPLVRQERNPHDYWRDFDLERIGYEVTPALVDGLAALELRGDDYASCLEELAGWLDAEAEALAPRHVANVRAYAGGALAWVEAVRAVDG